MRRGIAGLARFAKPARHSGRLTGGGRHRTVSRRRKVKGERPMPANFKAILITRDADKKQSVGITELSEADLMEGDVTVSVEYTTVNYKDGLAITGKAPVVRRFPLVPGIDFAGTVHRLVASRFRSRRQGRAQRLGRRRDASRRLCPAGPRQGRLAGAAARRADARATPWRSAPRATPRCSRSWRSSATASTPDRGPVVVTGAAGGVGSVAISLLSQARLPRRRLDRPAAGKRLS